MINFVFSVPRYILLKEKNMLLTMEHEAKRECNFFPNPERIDKVSVILDFLSFKLTKIIPCACCPMIIIDFADELFILLYPSG